MIEIDVFASKQARTPLYSIYVYISILYLIEYVYYLKDAQCRHFDNAKRYLPDCLNFQYGLPDILDEMNIHFHSKPP